MVVQEVLRIGKVNKLGMWVPHELPENRKNHCFEVLSSPFILNNNEPFLDQIMTWCNEKWILNNDQQRPVQWSDWEKALEILRKAKLSPKKKSHGHCLVVCCWSDPLSFLNPSETITPEKYAQQIDDIYWKLQCLRPALVNTKGSKSSIWQHPTTRHTTNTTQVEQIDLQSFASSAIFTWPLANWLPFFQAARQFYAEKMLP